MVRKGFARVWSDIPIEWKEIIENNIESNAAKMEGAKSVSEYIRALIRRDLGKKGLIDSSLEEDELIVTA